VGRRKNKLFAIKSCEREGEFKHEVIEKAKKCNILYYMRNLALTLGLLVTVSFGAFARTPQKTSEMHCTQYHNGKRAKSIKDLIKALHHCKIAMALPPAERKVIMDWFSPK